MYFLLAHEDNNADLRRFLLPKIDGQSEEWVEIKIDEKAGQFFAKKGEEGVYRKCKLEKISKQRICKLFIFALLAQRKIADLFWTSPHALSAISFAIAQSVTISVYTRFDIQFQRTSKNYYFAFVIIEA